MPTYDYVCAGCQHAFEEFQQMSDAPLVRCPSCGRRRLKRLFGTGSGVIFKGSGFYETDYKRKSSPTSAAEGEDKKGAEASKAESKSESKPEPKPESKPEPKPEAKPESKGGSSPSKKGGSKAKK